VQKPKERTLIGPAEAPLNRATSSRNAGRNHLGTPGDIKSEWWATSSRIRGRLPPESAPYGAIGRFDIRTSSPQTAVRRWDSSSAPAPVEPPVSDGRNAEISRSAPELRYRHPFGGRTVQRQVLLWNTPDELAEGLNKLTRAVIGAGPGAPDPGEILPCPPMTLGNTAVARVRFTVWWECHHQVAPDPAEMAARYGAETPCPIGVNGWSAPNAAAGRSIWWQPSGIRTRPASRDLALPAVRCVLL
jgi:hypothetical protein